MKRLATTVAVLAGIILLATSGLAGVDFNELVNPSFEQGGEGWEFGGNVLFDAGFDRQHVAYDQANQGEAGYLRQVIDNSTSPYWNPDYNHKIIDLSFWVFTSGTGSLQVGIDWWDNNDQERPRPGTPADHQEILPDRYVSEGQWTQYTLTYDFQGKPGNNQPRWVSLEFYFNGCTGTGNAAALDEIVFQSRCVPEPSSLIAMMSGVAGFAGFAWRRRRTS
ncbi:MAG: PEP-CTERM sorting domain-containing protein [Armatimonadetes bacterium]|nr:PEP-CTERM sorting domain-containing protein [Armatimonadota bacterium]